MHLQSLALRYGIAYRLASDPSKLCQLWKRISIAFIIVLYCIAQKFGVSKEINTDNSALLKISYRLQNIELLCSSL